MLRTLKGQSILEYSIVITVIIAALFAMQVYVKRGMQGRWKEAADQVGEQYDPLKTVGSTTQRMVLNGITSVSTERGTFEGEDGYFSMRSDYQNQVETQDSSVTTGH